MNLSQMPVLKETRDELARKIHRRRKGAYLDAVKEANVIIQRSIKGARAGVTDTLTAAKPRKAKTAKRAKTAETATRKAARRAVREALTAAQAPSGQSAATAEALASTPLHQLDMETGDAVMAGTWNAYIQASGLKAPFWQGFGA